LSSVKEALNCEAKAKAPSSAGSEVTTTSFKSRALLGSARLAASDRSKALSVQISSSCEANATLCRVQPRLSCEAKAKTPLCANSVVDSVSLPLPAPSAKVLSREARTKELSAKDLSCEAKNEAPLSANK